VFCEPGKKPATGENVGEFRSRSGNGGEESRRGSRGRGGYKVVGVNQSKLTETRLSKAAGKETRREETSQTIYLGIVELGIPRKKKPFVGKEFFSKRKVYDVSARASFFLLISSVQEPQKKICEGSPGENVQTSNFAPNISPVAGESSRPVSEETATVCKSDCAFVRPLPRAGDSLVPHKET